MYDAYRASANPDEYLRKIAASNPMIAQLTRAGDLRGAFYTMCQQRGVDPNSILNQFK